MLYLGSTEMQEFRTSDLMLYFEQKAKEAEKELKILPSKLKKLRKEIEGQKNLLKRALKEEDYYLINAYCRKIEVWTRFEQYFTKLEKEYKEQILDFDFLLAMTEYRRHDAQVRKFTPMDAADLLVIASILRGASRSHAGKPLHGGEND